MLRTMLAAFAMVFMLGLAACDDAGDGTAPPPPADPAAPIQ